MSVVEQNKNVMLSDEEILEITKRLYDEKIINKNLSREERDRLISLMPMTTKEIDFFVSCGESRQELEEENRIILQQKGWLNEL